MNCACCGAECVSAAKLNGLAICDSCFYGPLRADEIGAAYRCRTKAIAAGAPPTTSGLSDEQQARVEAARKR
jgi:hypothetical protein